MFLSEKMNENIFIWIEKTFESPACINPQNSFPQAVPKTGKNAQNRFHGVSAPGDKNTPYQFLASMGYYTRIAWVYRLRI